MPLAVVCHGRARRCSGTGPCVDCTRVLWVQGRGVSIRGKIVLSRNPEYKTRGVAMRLNVAYPGSLLRSQKFRYENECALWVLLTRSPRGSEYSGKIRFIELQGVNGHRRPLPGAPSSGRHGRARQSSGRGPCGD